MAHSPSPLTTAVRPIKALFASDAFEGILLIFVACAAILAANSPLAHQYHDLFHGTLPWAPVDKLGTLHQWINEALMAIFFFVVGLEVKREIIDGNLADAKSRRLPVMAAIAGMAAPAAVYMLIAGDDVRLQSGWAIPAATDIAFAMGVIGLLGSRVPPALRLFLLTVAIVDDIGAVLVIALFYTANIKLAWLLASLLVLRRAARDEPDGCYQDAALHPHSDRLVVLRAQFGHPRHDRRRRRGAHDPVRQRRRGKHAGYAGAWPGRVERLS